MKKILKQILPTLLILAMIAGLLPAWTVPVKAASEITISENTAYDGVYHISDNTTLNIAKGVTFLTGGFCFDGNYTLTVTGAGTLTTGDITAANSEIIFTVDTEVGRFIFGDINGAFGSKMIVNRGSVKLNGSFLLSYPQLSDGTSVSCATVRVDGLSGITDVVYSVDGGSAIESSTDENGKLYLWLTEGSHTIAVSDGTTDYSAWISTEKSSWNNAIACPVAAAENYISNKNMAITEPGNYSITGSGVTSNRILVTGGVGSAENPVNITLRNVNIDMSPAGGCAFLIGTGSYVHLTLSGDNTLKSVGYYAGLNVPEGATLIIDEDFNTAAEDSLAAIGEDGAGIGANRDGYYGGNGGTVIINGGKITAESTDGAGIGGAAGYRGSEGVCGAGGTVTITGGKVTALSHQYGAGIGGGGGDYYEGAGGTTTISGGTVTASGDYGSGIGRGSGGNTSIDPGTCVITGGSVKVSGGNFEYALEPAPMYCDSLTDKTPAYLTMITVGVDPVKLKNVTYSVDDGNEIETSTDADGKLFLWLAEGSHTLSISDETRNYSASLMVSSAGTNEGTADVATTTVYSIENDKVTISKAGNYVINGTGSTTANAISISDDIKGIINITLNNVNIDASGEAGGCAFRMGNAAKVNLIISGSNTLKSSDCNPGLLVENNSLLTISEDSATTAIDSLTAIGGNNAAGIGGGFGFSGHRCGNVMIYGGIVNAFGGMGAAGIGGGYGGHGPGGSGGNVTVYGGTVKAAGTSDGYDTPADIGHGTGADGNGGDGSVTIIGGSVKADLMGPATVYYNEALTPAYLTVITVGAVPVKSQDVTYTLKGGQKAVSCPTDENGLLYLWLPESNSTTIDISAAGTVYEAVGAITTSANGNARTALAIPEIIDTEPGVNLPGSTEIDISTTGGTTTAIIPQMAFNTLAGSDTNDLTINTPVGSVMFDHTALDSINKRISGSVTLTITQVDASALSAEEQVAIGRRPIYDLSITSGGMTISDFDGGTATVSVPYKPLDGEDTNKIVVYYISNGRLIMVPNCAYDASTGMITFTTTHFSIYAIGYNDVSFADVSGWYKGYVDFLSARNIIHGTGNTTFSPDKNITRAEFVTILANLSGDDLSGYTTSSFTDVAATDWYCKVVEWAFKNGIAVGSDSKFNPNAKIPREQMAVMLYNYAKYARLDVSNTEGLTIRKFSDYENISGWASEPIQWAMNAGILSGNSDGRFAPKAGATRAEAAKIIAIFFQGMVR